MSLRCAILGHSLVGMAPLYNQCRRCKQAFYTDYFASRERGYCVRIRVSQRELQRAIDDKRNGR